MRFLSVAGTAAMFLVGGGILTHNLLALDVAIETIRPYGVIGTVLGMLSDLVAGVIVGAAVFGGLKLTDKLRATRSPASA